MDLSTSTSEVIREKKSKKIGIIHRDLKPENVFVTIGITGEYQVYKQI